MITTPVAPLFRASALPCAFVALLACATPLSFAQSPAFLGQYCWTITINDSTVEGLTLPATRTMNTNIVDMANGSYALTGYVLEPNDNPAIYGGVGHMVNGTLYLNLNGSQSHKAPLQDRDTSVLHAEMNTSNFTGSFYEVGSDFNLGTRMADPMRYSAGNMALTATCP
jgi:hypothetical protein